jgi:hypothetical protein
MEVTITNWVTVIECAVVILGTFYVKGFVDAAIKEFRNRKK